MYLLMRFFWLCIIRTRYG